MLISFVCQARQAFIWSRWAPTMRTSAAPHSRAAMIELIQELTVRASSVWNVQLTDSTCRGYRSYRCFGGLTVHESVHGTSGVHSRWLVSHATPHTFFDLLPNPQCVLATALDHEHVRLAGKQTL